MGLHANIAHSVRHTTGLTNRLPEPGTQYIFSIRVTLLMHSHHSITFGVGGRRDGSLAKESRPVVLVSKLAVLDAIPDIDEDADPGPHHKSNPGGRG